MKIAQLLLENSDYNIAKKLYKTLSRKAQKLLIDWQEWNSIHEDAPLTREFENNTALAKEIWDARQPIRDNIKSREGDSIKLYRGIVYTSRENHRSSRLLYSWTSSKKIAKIFADYPLESKTTKITRQDVESALKKYNQRGYVFFNGQKYLRDKENPDQYKRFTIFNDQITGGTNIQDDFEKQARLHNQDIDRVEKNKGRIIEKSIPVNDIVWVLMEYNENEYIIKGHS